MIAFAPFDEPRYALALVVEDAVSGGISAAPCVREIMQSLFSRDTAAAGDGGAGTAEGTDQG
jgi:penicillin-binding protein 2